MKTNENLNILKSVTKTLAVLDCFIEKEEITFSELIKLSKLDNSTLNRIINSLTYNEYLTKNEKSGLYSLGKKILLLGLKVINKIDFKNAVHPVLKNLAAETKETANAAILLENELAYIDIVEGSFALRLSAKIGDKANINSTALGKAIVANLGENKSEEILNKINFVKRTENTISNKDTFKKELNKVIKNGYAIDNEEDEPGVKCIASAVFDHSHEVIGAISISGPVGRINIAIDKNIELVKSNCKIISSELGHYQND